MFKLFLDRDQIANIRWIMEKARNFQKNIYFCFIDYAKAFDWASLSITNSQSLLKLRSIESLK